MNKILTYLASVSLVFTLIIFISQKSYGEEESQPILEQLEILIGPIAIASPTSEIKSPGMLRKHYSPNASLRLDVHKPLKGEVLIGFGPHAPKTAINLSPTGDLIEAATNFFSTLRKLDSEGTKRLAVMPIPKTGLGLAINDRLKRAAAIS